MNCTHMLYRYKFIFANPVPITATVWTLQTSMDLVNGVKTRRIWKDRIVQCADFRGPFYIPAIRWRHMDARQHESCCICITMTMVLNIAARKTMQRKTLFPASTAVWKIVLRVFPSFMLVDFFGSHYAMVQVIFFLTLKKLSIIDILQYTLFNCRIWFQDRYFKKWFSSYKVFKRVKLVNWSCALCGPHLSNSGIQWINVRKKGEICGENIV